MSTEYRMRAIDDHRGPKLGALRSARRLLKQSCLRKTRADDAHAATPGRA